VKRALVLAAALLIFPATAHAGWRIDRAQQIAGTVWHHPCQGNVNVVWEPLPDDVTDLASAWVQPGKCTVHIVIGNGLNYAWQDICPLMIHEYGHLAGYRDPANTGDPIHSLNEHSVMYGGSMHEEDLRCAGRGRPFLVAHHG
jgi:hypothetical protein